MGEETMKKDKYNDYLQILKEELVPAMGCTEPIAIAYAAAKAREVLGKKPQKIIAKCSGNIVKNAITHSPLKEKIIIKLTDSELSVENTGITIPKDQLGEIFNAFYRVDKSRNRKTGGTGLGLYIVKTILDKHENISYKILCKENSVVFKMMFKK